MMQLWVIFLVALWGSSRGQRALPISSFKYPSAPLLPIAPLYEYTRIRTPQPLAQSRITTQVFYSASAPTIVRQQHTSIDPCIPTPCGPNTFCEVNSKNIALCKCQTNFVPDGHTINGCKPQCISNYECPDNYRCDTSTTKCVRLCQQNDCGFDANCRPRNHKSVCSCPSGFHGNPDISCSREQVQADPIFTDPCTPNPCGLNAQCRSEGNRAICTCLSRYEGDPLSNCRRSECIASDDCRSHQACQQRRCIDPCNIPGICGTQTECTVRNHQPVCSCRRGYVGDPFTRCRRFDPEELCRPSPCGRNTKCRVQNNRAVCTCIENYIGDPLTVCRPECVVDSECQRNFACSNNRCINPCRQGACGDGALCNVANGRAICTCPQYYLGNPHSRCYPECTEHEACRSYQACYQLKCVDPCVGACGTGADCRVERHKPICSCPKGYTGHPFESCRKFDPADLCRPNPCGRNADCTPGYDKEGNDRPVCTCPRGYVGNPLHGCTRGECEVPQDCPRHKTCYNYQCQSACYTNTGPVCGSGADCTMKNHRPVCSCPRGFIGNPLIRCNIDATSRYSVGRSKRNTFLPAIYD
uniref:Neurogenic locus notch homolog protein 3-like n=1 Tax=Hirondellea gigas TaxID=1518452 RepID=A0A6A7FWN7_9CRUS